MEEEDITEAPSVTEPVNIMTIIKNQSAEKNIKVYVISVLALGRRLEII